MAEITCFGAGGETSITEPAAAKVGAASLDQAETAGARDLEVGYPISRIIGGNQKVASE